MFKLINLTTRAFSTLFRYKVGKGRQFGTAGEMAARPYIEALGGHTKGNVIIPPAFPDSRYIVGGEADFIVCMGGTLFCIEIKRWRGILHPQQNEKILQIRRQNTRVHKDPFIQVQNCVRRLRGFVSRKIDARFGSLRIVPVVCFFREETDISAIYHPDKVIYIDELARFCAAHGNTSGPVPSWIANIIAALPTWDQLWTTDGQVISGVLATSEIVFKAPDGRKYALSIENVHIIEWHRPSLFDGLFSSVDNMIVHYTDGSRRSFACVNGTLTLRQVGATRKHHFRNLQRLVVGTRNNPYWE